MKKQNETLFKSLKAALEAGNKAEAEKFVAELEATNLTAEDKKHLSDVKMDLTDGDFAKALEHVKYLW